MLLWGNMELRWLGYTVCKFLKTRNLSYETSNPSRLWDGLQLFYVQW